MEINEIRSKAQKQYESQALPCGKDGTVSTHEGRTKKGGRGEETAVWKSCTGVGVLIRFP